MFWGGFHLDAVGNWDLPKAEREIAEVIGRSAAIRLSWRMLHTRCFVRVKDGKVENRFVDLYVPKACTQQFVETVGNEADAKKLVASLQGMNFRLSGCKKAFRRLHTHVVRALFEKGASRDQLMLASRLTDRHLRRLCAGIQVGTVAELKVLSIALAELSALSFMINAEPLWTQHDDKLRTDRPSGS